MKPNSKIAVALTLSAIALSGCYVVPTVDSRGYVQYDHYALPPVGVPVVAAPDSFSTVPAPLVPPWRPPRSCCAAWNWLAWTAA